MSSRSNPSWFFLAVAIGFATPVSIAPQTSFAQSAAQPAQRATRPPEASSGQSAQTARVITGTLTCRGSGTVGLILGSKQRLSCTFERSKDGTTANYSATITRIGLDIGVTGRNVMIWTVLASSDNLPASALAGSYAEVAANASVGAGVGANALIGGNRNSVVLQPLSVQAQTEVNIAAGVAASGSPR